MGDRADHKLKRGSAVTETQIPSGQSQMDGQAESGMRRRVFIGVSLCLAVGAFITTVGIVWNRSTRQKPGVASSVLVVEGNKEYEGTAIVVKGPALQKPLEAKITESKLFVCRFALPRGEYDVTINFPDGSRWPAKVQMDEHQFFWMSRARLEECKKAVERAYAR
jgi:hypothetical protein